MNIAVTTDNWTTIAKSAEQCRDFMVYEIGAGEILNSHPLTVTPQEILATSDITHENHPLDGVLVLIAGGMGKEVEKKLKAIGITPFVTDEKSPDAAILHYLKGDLHVEPAGFHREHRFHLLQDEEGFVPAAGTKKLRDLN